MLKEVKIEGLRGFSKKATVELAIPNGKGGSGLTTLVGMNNSGKTTILEALKYYNIQDDYISFSQNKRNTKCNSRVSITYVDFDKSEYTLSTVKRGGSKVFSELGNSKNYQENNIFSLQSRRYVDFEFHSGMYGDDRSNYIVNDLMNSKSRKNNMQNYSWRIFKWDSNNLEFNKILHKVIDKNIDWYIEENDNNMSFLVFRNKNSTIHTGEGIGDGIWSIFTIVDALYDSKEGSIITIDEPELSIHPMYQKKILDLLLEYSKDRQIIVSTHSPYFISWESVINGGIINRVYKDTNDDIAIRHMNEESIKTIEKFLRDNSNVHTLGLEAKELFFLEDNIIVVEGQDDVFGFNKVRKNLNIDIRGYFFGWGAGGAEKIKDILNMLKDLGYEKVVAIYDGDKEKEKSETEIEFPNYKFMMLWEDDIRDKKNKNKKMTKLGVLNSDFTIQENTKEKLREFLLEIKEYFN